MKGICLSLKTVVSDFLFFNFHNIFFLFKVGSQFSALKSVCVQPPFSGTLPVFFANFFTYSESPFNSLIDEGLKCKNYPMGIEVMAVLKKLLADARIDSARGGHHHQTCLLYTSPSPRDRSLSRMPSSA